jgi:hypothetical protein
MNGVTGMISNVQYTATAEDIRLGHVNEQILAHAFEICQTRALG